jgi:hypothetical protein
MTIVESARRDWADGHRRFLELADEPAAAAAGQQELRVVLDELRRRVGSTFTLAELGEAYLGAEIWAQRALAERAVAATWARRISTVVDEAFYVHSRSAVDYTP